MKPVENVEEGAPPPRPDGRKLRSERSREAIVDAMLVLIEEGRVRPTSAAIAAKAGVSVRSVFQHFADMDDIFVAVADRQALRVGALYARHSYEGDFETRLAEWVERRAGLYEMVASIRRAAIAQERTSPSIHARLQLARSLARKDLANAFSQELGESDPKRLVDDPRWQALAAVGSFRFWDTLRVTGRLSPEAAGVALTTALRSLLTS